MINSIIDFSIKNKLVIGLFILAWIILGIWSMTKVPVDAVPDITNNQVQVITVAPNLATEDIEQFVTYPIELGMANLPDVEEIRSISRFGLSLVTIVFKDDMGTYLPRQLVSERLVQVREDIPEGMGDMEIGPISTGLGEIYQYTLEVDEAFRGKYSVQDLRTYQDWIVRRQMAMTPGVVEVNSFGGSVKQYEVVVRPHELKAIGLTISDVFTALENNNQNTGGAYIVKDHAANFIRGEGLARSLSDLENALIINQNGIPVYVKDVADVRIGSAIRYGAVTKDGKGEAVGGTVMMLKDANSNQTIKSVKARVTEIEKSLPDGIRIVPFLDRSQLIGNTTGTVRNNLIEGGLIVILVLVVLLGNWRGGLVVASTIPLSMLFAFILMNAFNVWANLMSLGAIDFGIIVDGSVIIVESTVFMLYKKYGAKATLSRKQRDDIASDSSKRMMNAAFFGQLIILIVFIPILALEGIEGKMFKPMALTFIFAMLGAMILGLTYVPMMSSLFINSKKTRISYWGDRFIQWIEKWVDRGLNRVLIKPKPILMAAALLFGTSIWIFTRLGGEFIPQLDEGDIAFHIMLRPGSSLEESIHTSTEVEKILIQEFPEILQVVSRFGVSDVPTDPMPMDVADCFVILKPKDEWTSAYTKDELIEKIKKSIEHIPGVTYEFTQPIEMRFNELITGVREDVAIKIFGDDLDLLADKANEITQIIGRIDGVGDLKAESTMGLPQITIKYQRNKLGQYGLNVKDLNILVQTAFAGSKAGVVFEDERRVDLVVRLHEDYRRGIDHVRNIFVTLPGGNQIPLKEVAEINYQPGPMQISRENTHRRTYVGINVRGRDVESLIDEIKPVLDKELDLPPGYYLKYGGAFENLQRATQKLKIVVPISLALIFILIFLALGSLKHASIIFTAIPFAAIGGVFSLWIRDLPFSISAGIGFIVLFGVAVLNGLVLISGLNELKKEEENLTERIRKGTTRRVRPILLTALTDVLGFMPMALSVSAGAEVQRPLATVVIGGLLTSSLLTLFLLPILYQWTEKISLKSIKMKGPAIVTVIITMLFLPVTMGAQNEILEIVSVDQAISVGLRNNGNVQVARKNLDSELEMKRTSFNPGKTDVDFQYGQYNSVENDMAFTVTQNFEFPTVYSNQNRKSKARIKSGESLLAVSENELTKNIRENWYELMFLREKKKLLLYQDSLYSRFLHAATLRYETQATSYLEKATAETRVMELDNAIEMLEADIQIEIEQLTILMNSDSLLHFTTENLQDFPISETLISDSIRSNPILDYYKNQIEVANAEKSIQSSKFLPDLSVGYFNISMIGTPLSGGEFASSSDRFSGVNAGISIPLFFGSYSGRANAADIQLDMAITRASYYKNEVESRLRQEMQEYLKYSESLRYYREKALPQSELIIKTAQLSFENGAINYIEYFQNMNQALDLKFKYLETLNGYNQVLIRLNYLKGQ